MPRFAVLEHHINGVHWDFMLEHLNCLLTWRLDHEPVVPPPIDAVAIQNHRLRYLDYQGPISEDRGHVIQWDRGFYQWRVHESDSIEVTLEGSRLVGRVELKAASERWLFSYLPASRSQTR